MRSVAPKRIGLLLERIIGFNHDVLIGIRDFAAPPRSWICHFTHPAKEFLPTLSDWRPDGLMAFLFDKELAEAMWKIGVPFVDVANWETALIAPRVTVDDVAVGRMAADYLNDLGLERFAFLGPAKLAFSEERLLGFQSRLSEFGRSTERYIPSPNVSAADRPFSMGEGDRELQAWLHSLPKPVGLFAANDDYAALASEACYVAGIDVPNQVGILGVDNDPYLGSLCYPPLSSIATPARKVGYEAAALLNRMMNGMPAPTQTLRIPPIGVVARRSTNLLAIEDPYLASAVRFIREHATRPIDVMDVVDHVPVGRRTLEKLFRDYLDRTPLEEIRRVRISRAQHLLATTDLTVETIAMQTGFGSGSWLSSNFRQTCGMSPGVYRRQFQESEGD